MLNFEDKLVRISAAGALSPSQDTLVDQLNAFYRQNAIPFVRHSPLPVAAQEASTAAGTRGFYLGKT